MIIELNKNYVEKLFDKTGNYYSQLRNILKYIFPQHVDEICTDKDNLHEIHELSVLLYPYYFSKHKIKNKQVDKGSCY